MPPTRHNGSAKSRARAAPYPNPSSNDPIDTSLEHADHDKENVPQETTTSTSTSKAPTKKKSAAKAPNRDDLPSNYRDIPLKEIRGEVPVYENATAIRRKLNKLLESKTQIPGSTKTWTQTSLAAEIQAIAQKSNPVKTYAGVGNQGPCVASLRRFLKKTGGMAGGDSGSYYFGNMLLEKLRIWNGEKKTKAREQAEKEFPNGRHRCDPNNMYIIHKKGDPMPSYSKLANSDRGFYH